MLNLLLLVLGLYKFDIADARKYTVELDHDKALFALSRIEPTATNYKEYCYLQAVNYFGINKGKQCRSWLEKYKDSFETKSPRRYDVLVAMMEADLERWKEGDLYDIERDMKNSAARLGNAKSNQKTQQVQKDIVDKLDKLIKQEEDKNNKASASNALPKSQDNPQPIEESRIAGGSGSGKVDERKFAQYAREWGSLPPAKRAAVLREIERELPPKYKAQIEEYLRTVNRYRGDK